MTEKNQVDPDTLMVRTIAARRYVNGTLGMNDEQNRKLEMAAFLNLFHSDLDEDTKRKLIRETGRKDR